MPQYLLVYAPVFVIFVMSVVIHEVSHGYVAYQLGDLTAKSRGRLSLNPLKHIDPIMTILVPLILFYTTGIIFGGAKPVPVNPFLFRGVSARRGMMYTALAGPLSNIGIALVLALTLALSRVFTGLLHYPGGPTLAETALSMGIIVNLYLAAFNLLPVPPLDGSRVLAGLAGREVADFLDRIEPYGLFILIVLINLPAANVLFAGLGRAVSLVAGLLGVR